MDDNTSFLPGFSTKFCGRKKRSQLEALRIQREKILENSITDLGVLFSDILPIDWLDDEANEKRKRLFPKVNTFWAWASQVLEQNESCAKALTLIQSWYCRAGIDAPAFDTSGYCKTRKRISSEFLDKIVQKIDHFANARLEDQRLWYGHRLKAIDGTSVKLMDTPKNQRLYPQPASQKSGCGFPVMGIVGVLDLAKGTLCDFVTGKWKQQDAKGLYQLKDCFKPGDVVIADRAYCGYDLIALLKNLNTDSVMRLHQKRESKLDWRRGKKLGPNSRLVIWEKPPKRGKCDLRTCLKTDFIYYLVSRRSCRCIMDSKTNASALRVVVS